MSSPYPHAAGIFVALGEDVVLMIVSNTHGVLRKQRINFGVEVMEVAGGDVCSAFGFYEASVNSATLEWREKGKIF